MERKAPVLKGLNLSLKPPLTQGERTNWSKNEINKLPRLSNNKKGARPVSRFDDDTQRE